MGIYYCGGMMSIKNSAMTSGVILFVVLLLIGCGGGGGGSDTSVNPQTPRDESLVTLVLGVTKTVASQTVPASGADIIVDAPEDPLDGLEILVQDGSYEEGKDFTISSTPIVGHSGNPHFNPVTPLITVQNGGEYSTRAMALKIPVTIKEGFHYMAFFYDENTGRLDGIPELTHDANSITVATRHFSQVVVNKMEITKELAEGTFESGYRVGTDNWSFVNDGSYLSPNGICSGMSMTSLYYYAIEKSILKGDDLYKSFRGDNVNDWRDDAKGVKFTSMAQLWHNNNLDDTRAWLNINKTRETYAWTYFLFMHALKVTGQPQYMAILPAAAGDGHALVVYKKEGDSLFIADPNSPADATAKIEFIWLGDDPVKIPLGDWLPYIGSWNVGSDPVAFTRVFYVGQTALMNWDEIARLFEKVEDGSIGDSEFPEYTLTLTDWAADELGLDVPMTSGYVTEGNSIEVSVDSYVDGFEPVISVFIGLTEDSDYQDGIEVPLEPGINRIGVYVTDRSDGSWVDFKYFDIIQACEEGYELINGACVPIVTCEAGEEAINGICVPIGCNLPCSNPVVSDTITLPSHDGTHTIEIEFQRTHKMCAQTVIDPASISGKITMLYFYEAGGTGGPYSEPYSSTWQMSDGAKVITGNGAEPLKVVDSGLPYANSSTRENLLAWHDFGFVAGNYSSMSQYNDRDFTWFDYYYATDTSATTVVNPETVDKYGCYTGQY
jgi:hypothetical protein